MPIEFVAVEFGKCRACDDDDLLNMVRQCSSCANVGALSPRDVEEGDEGSELIPA